jgi:hypothetical protein
VTALVVYTGPPAKQRREANTTPGRCSNLDYCSIGMQRVLVHVPVGERFVCPECGKNLKPPTAGMDRRPIVIPALRILVLILGIALGLGAGYLIGLGYRPAPKPVPVASAATALKVNTARAALGLPKLEPDVITPAAPPPAPPPQPAQPAPRAYPPVQERPYPTRAPPLETADPSQHLVNEHRFGQVTVDCTLTNGKPSCRVGNLRGADTFSAPALDWLKNLSVQYAPTAQPGDPGQPDHRWRIIFEDFAGGAPAPAPAPPPRRK